MTALQMRGHFAQQPGLAHGAAADHDTVRVRMFERAICIPCRSDITIYNNRETDCLYRIADAGPVRLAFIELAAGTPMNRHHAKTGTFCILRQIRRIEHVSIPAKPHLERDGPTASPFQGSVDDGPCEIRLSHEGGA